jgi:uncharacterized surface protein with fasciclin (FAS1) repeats
MGPWIIIVITSPPQTLLLSGHVLSPLIIPTQNMVNGTVIGTTPAGTTLTITVEFDVEFGLTNYIVNDATTTIVISNVLAQNGIIHALSSVLEVPGAEISTIGDVTECY